MGQGLAVLDRLVAARPVVDVLRVDVDLALDVANELVPVVRVDHHVTVVAAVARTVEVDVPVAVLADLVAERAGVLGTHCRFSFR